MSRHTMSLSSIYLPFKVEIETNVSFKEALMRIADTFGIALFRMILIPHFITMAK